MREFLFQIILFVASTLVALVISLLKPNRIKELVRYIAFMGISISLLLGGYEFGSRQKEPVLKEKEALANRQEMNTPSPDVKLTVNLASTSPKEETSKVEIKNRDEDIIKKIVSETDSKDIAGEKNTNSPTVLEPTWIASGASVPILSGQVMIRIRDYYYYDIVFDTDSEPDFSCGENHIARIDINAPDVPKTHECLNIGERASFTYKGRNYWINLLDANNITENIDTMSKLNKEKRPEFMISFVMAQ